MKTWKPEVITIFLFLSAVARADMVTARWGVEGHVQHRGALTYESAGDDGTVISVDLSLLPRETTVYRARLVFRRPGLYGRGFDIVPCDRREDGAVSVTGPELELVPPVFLWFDATGALRQWHQKETTKGHFFLRRAPEFKRDATYLEIAYEGAPVEASLPAPVTGIEAFYRSGQVFITFREIEDYAGGARDITWGELGKRFDGVHPSGPVPRDEAREIRYRVYMHDEAITPRTIGHAELLSEVAPGSGYNPRLVPGGDFIKRRPDAVALRLAVEPEKPLEPRRGLYVHNVRRDGRKYFAVVSTVNGVENTLQLSAENTVGPIEQRRGPPAPVRQLVPQAHGHEHAGVTELRDGRTYREEWYSYWAVPPCAPHPMRYDFAVGYCVETLEHPASLTFIRGHTWNSNPEMPRPEARRDLVLSMSTDNPNGFWTGINDARETLKGIEEGRWRPFTQNRQEALIRWAQTNFAIDPERIYSAIGAWGMWEIRRADLYAYLHGWGMPEVTKGFQCWNWARGAWGPPAAYKDRPKEENPYYLQDTTRWILEDPSRELPFLSLHTGWGAHFTEMGWPPFPRFVRALMDTKRAFCMQSPALRSALDQGLIEFRRGQSVPAFGNCSLDDNLGSGELGTGTAFGQVNGYLVWESATIVDEPGFYEITVMLFGGDAHGRGAVPLDECTVDLTPRKCQGFRPAKGTLCEWTNTTVADGRVLQSGRAVTDRFGLVTLRALKVTKEKHRITLRLSARADEQ